MELDFEVDKITESIEDAATGESFETLVLPVLSAADLDGVTKANGWQFDWGKELRLSGRQVYKLIAEKEPDVIHGLISLEAIEDHIEMHLLESAPFNFGKAKKYLGVAPNLVAYGCKISKDVGFDGAVAFMAKTALIEHYEEALGAVHVGGNRMIIYEDKAEELIKQYFL